MGLPLCLPAIRQLQRDRRLSLPIIRRHLESLDVVELERLAVAFLPELGTPPAAAVVAPLRAPAVACARWRVAWSSD